MAKDKKSGCTPPRITNRRAWSDYQILEVLECGIELTGTEVKSIRGGAVRLEEAHARIRDGEVFLVGANIAIYPQAKGVLQHDPTRPRRLPWRRPWRTPAGP